MTDIQALIEEAKNYEGDNGTARCAGLIRDLAAALPALSSLAETETDWEYRHAESYPQPNDDPILYTYGPGLEPDDSFATFGEAFESRIEDSDVVVRRRKSGPWEVV